jgi:hypothetical protein
MILHKGERVYWGAPEVIYLEGMITALDEEKQTVTIHIERATPHSAHLIDSEMPFAADGVKPLSGESPPGTTSERSKERRFLPPMSDEEKIQRAAAAAVHQQYGYHLPTEQEERLIAQVVEIIQSDPGMKQQIIASMNEILNREH